MKLKDPRPELREDSELWLDMLVQAEKYSGQLVGNLYEMRHQGTRIRHGQHGYVMYPDAGQDVDQYRESRDRLLGPYREQLRDILAYLLAEFHKLGKPPRGECSEVGYCRWLDDCDMYPFIEQGIWLCRNRVGRN